MNDNLDEIKNRWKQLAVDDDRLRRANEELSQRMLRNGVTSNQERLARRARINSYIGLLLPLLAPMLYFELELPPWFCILYALYGIILFGLITAYHLYISRKPLVSLPVVEAVRRALAIKLRQKWLHIVSLSMGIPLLTAFFFILDGDDEAAIWGAIIGLVVGLAIGISKMLTDFSIARRIIKSLQDSESDEADCDLPGQGKK